MFSKDLTQRRKGAEDAKFLFEDSLFLLIFFLKHKVRWKKRNFKITRIPLRPLRLCAFARENFELLLFLSNQSFHKISRSLACVLFEQL